MTQIALANAANKPVKTKDYLFFLVFSLAYSYLKIRYFRSEMKRKTSFPFAFRSLIE